MSNGARVTAEDVAESNRMAVNRTAALGRQASGVLLVVAAVNIAGWMWSTYRTQSHLDDSQLGNVPSSLRFDLFVQSLGLLYTAALVIGVALTLRMAADYLQSRDGGSITGLTIGDALPVAEPDPGDERLDTT